MFSSGIPCGRFDPLGFGLVDGGELPGIALSPLQPGRVRREVFTALAGGLADAVARDRRDFAGVGFRAAPQGQDVRQRLPNQ